MTLSALSRARQFEMNSRHSSGVITYASTYLVIFMYTHDVTSLLNKFAVLSQLLSLAHSRFYDTRDYGVC